jgi:uncharacterized protein
LNYNHALKLIFAASLVCGCSANTAYYQDLNIILDRGDFLAAAQFTEKSKEKAYGDKDSLLYELDEGMLLHLARDYGKSNEAFEKAKQIAENNFTKSVSNQAATFLISDNVRPYYGEDFERALINVFCALNYEMAGQESEALVEARQANQFLAALQTNYGYNNLYKEDAFVRYLMGMLYENQGEINDAYISYYQALQAYDRYSKDFGVPAPQDLVNDALRTASSLGFTDEIDTIQKTWCPAGPPATRPAYDTDEGEVVLVHYDGPSPVKIDNIVEIGFGKAWAYVSVVQPQGEAQEDVEKAQEIARGIVDTEQIKLAFPKYISGRYMIRGSRAELRDGTGKIVNKGVNEVVEDVGAIAKKNLDDHIARISMRTFARAAVKFALTHKISSSVEQSSNDKMLGWFVKKALTAASTATELADKRSWRTLPDKIQFVRLRAPQGTYDLHVDFVDKNDTFIEDRSVEGVKIAAGKKTFVIVKTLK